MGAVADGERNRLTKRQVAFAIALSAAAAWGVYWFFRAIEPDHVPETPNPDFTDTIFASPAVIAVARIALLSLAVVLLFASAYVVGSVVVRMGRREWLRRAGPFEPSLIEESAHVFGDVVNPLLEHFARIEAENKRLSRELEERDRLLAEAFRTIDEIESERRD